MVEQITKMHEIYGRVPEILRASEDNRCVGFASHPFGKIVGKPWSYCAIGTISHAMGDTPIRTFFLAWDKDKILEFCGIDNKYKHNSRKSYKNQSGVICPLCDKKMPVMKLVVHNNDYHNMSFSENADAIEKIDKVLD